MKHSSTLFVSLLAALTLFSCSEKIDLKDLDKTVSVDMGLALPIGTMTATLGDFMNMGKIPEYTMIDENGIIHFQDTFDVISNQFRKIEITDYPASTLKECKANKLAPVFGPGQYSYPFPITLDFDDVNNEGDDKRFDSIRVINAEYVSTLTLSEDLKAAGFKWEWIDQIDIILSEQFTRPGGKTMTVYKKGQSSATNFGDDVNIHIDNFALSLIKDETKPLTWDNMYKTAQIDAKIYLNIPEGTPIIPLTEESAFFYDIHLTMLEFSALWGWMQPDNKMRDNDTLVIADEWSMWKDLKKAKLPLAEPQLKLAVSSKIAGRFVADLNYLFVLSDEKPNEPVYATFNGNKNLHRPFAKDGGFILNPYTSEIGTEWNDTILLDYKPENGHFDELFKIRPDRIAYDFSVDMYEVDQYPELRLLPESSFKIKALLDIPFVLNNGLEFAYTDTVKDINLSKLSLDSLLNGALAGDNVQQANVVAYLSLENRLPLALSAKVTFVDENGKQVLKKDGKPLQVIKLGEDVTTAASDSLHLGMPKLEKMAGKNDTYIPSLQQDPIHYIIDVDKENFEVLASVKNIIFNINVDNTGDQNVKMAITKDSALKVKIGATARVNGKVDLDKILNSDKK